MTRLVIILKMSWWERYQAWQPESSWDRYKAWQLESRSRYVATGAGPRVLVVFFLSLFAGLSTGMAMLVTATFAAIGILLWWFWYYPRAKAKSQHRPGASVI